MATRKSFTKRVIRRIKRIISPKEADEIIRQEFQDERGNKFDFIMDVKPHKPTEPTIKGTVEYKD